MNSKLINVIAKLAKHGIEHEHIADDECYQDHYEFIELIDNGLLIQVAEYSDGFLYSIEDRGYPDPLAPVTEECFLAVFIIILNDHLARTID